MQPPAKIDQLKAILALPFMATVVIPAILYYLTDNWIFKPMEALSQGPRLIMGISLLTLGLPLFIQSINLFIKIGKGTLAPWNPTKNLVVKSLYRYMRNPMIMGVVLILLGEAFLIPSTAVFLWAIFFVILNHFYFVWKEEPDLVKRFGEEYLEYKKHVPRWTPRINGWRPEEA